MRLKIEKHTTIDKSFDVILDGVTLTVDYDDVDHTRVDAVVDTLAIIINKTWDDDTIKPKWLLHLHERWYSESDLRDEYRNFDLLCEDVGLYISKKKLKINLEM